MDFPRLAITVVLCFLVFILWEMFFVDREAIQPPSEVRQAEQMAREKPFKDIEKGIVDKKIMPKVISDKDKMLKPIKAARTITVNTPLYSVRISEKGAVFNGFILKDYKENGGDDSPLYQMISPEIRDKGTVLLGLAGNSIPGLNQAVFNVDRKAEFVNINDQSEEIVFSWVSENGVVVEKRFIFSPETYLIGLNVIIKNGSYQAIQDNLILSLMKTYSKATTMYGFEGPSALINNSLEQIKAKKIKDKNIYIGSLQWVTVQDRYFMSSIIPVKPVEASMRLFLSQDGSMLEAQYMQPETVIQSGMQHSYEYKLFFGPKSTKVLKQCDYNLSKAIDFGMFDFIAKPCLWFMNFLYGIIPNYGVAIIILTIVTKLILWPLGTKSYKSMAEMKKIQPLMTEIREKYKNDKKKMNEEIMALYKTYKVNPVGGCLPMIVQLPVFFALYRMLYEAIELRHAPFFGWITDLSAPDRLFSFGFSIPLMQPPYGIPVLTIIMGATMFLQQQMAPSVGDPTQAKMMKFMPVIFTVIFINFSSGLVLYWLINNILSIAQQHYITKK